MKRVPQRTWLIGAASIAAAALVIAAVAVREGVQTWRGRGCCAAPGLHGAACAGDCCDD